MGFFFFLLVNAALLLRPTELIPGLEDVPLYEFLILACLAFSFFSVLKQLTIRSLLSQPITVCVLGLGVAVVLSHLSHANITDSRRSGFEFFKVIVYYLLLVANLNSLARLRWFLLCLVGCIGLLSLLAVLQYHGVVDIPALATLEQKQFDEATGELQLIPRLRGAGIYHDPNDLCLVLCVGMAVSLYRQGSFPIRAMRPLWFVPLGLFGYALILTQSRGGILGLLAGTLVLFCARFGWRRAIGLTAIAVPVLFLLSTGRQSHFDIGDKEDTAQQRIQLWKEGLDLLREAPVFGVGCNEFAERAGLVAHNSFVHCYAELGVFGGTLFTGAFFCAFWTLQRLGSRRVPTLHPELRRLHAYLTAIVAAYAVGLLSLSRAYSVPTYMVLGLATPYGRLAAAYSPLPLLRVNWWLALRLAVVSVLALSAAYICVGVFVQLD
jgi:O-antigen ligase